MVHMEQIFPAKQGKGGHRILHARHIMLQYEFTKKFNMCIVFLLRNIPHSP